MCLWKHLLHGSGAGLHPGKPDHTHTDSYYTEGTESGQVTDHEGFFFLDGGQKLETPRSQPMRTQYEATCKISPSLGTNLRLWSCAALASVPPRDPERTNCNETDQLIWKGGMHQYRYSS